KSSTYWARCRSPRNCSWTRVRVAAPSGRRAEGPPRPWPSMRRRLEVGRMDEQQAVSSVDDVVLDAADTAGDERLGLPRRFGDGHSKPLDEALLNDQEGVPRQRGD